MLLHIGGDVVINLNDLVLILDARALAASRDSATYIQRAQAAGRVEVVALGEPKSYVICKGKVFVSPISAATLRRRAGSLDFAPQG